MDFETPAPRRGTPTASPMRRRTPRVSLVVAWAGARAGLERYLVDVGSLCHEFGVELVVVAPTLRPGNARFRTRFGAARVIGTDGELTAGPLRSRGVRAATGDVVLLLDETRPPGLPQLTAMLQQFCGPDAGLPRAVAPRDGANLT